MNKYSDDQRLTSYILGELSAEERLKFESELESSDELKHELEEIKKNVTGFTTKLGKEWNQFTQEQKNSYRHDAELGKEVLAKVAQQETSA